MSIDESPPPYSAVVATPESLESLSVALPFAHSDRVAAEIRALVSDGNALCLRFKEFHEVASADVKFEYQVPAFILSQKFDTLTWESRSIAGVALVAIKDFNEIILEFLSDPNATVQDRIRELTNASKLLKRERDSAARHRSSFDALIRELGDYSGMIHSESGALITERRRQTLSGGRGRRISRLSRSRVSRPPYIVPRPEPMNGISMATASFGAVSRTCMDYALHFEHISKQAVFPSCAGSIGEPLPSIHESVAGPRENPGEHKHACSPSSTGRTELAALVDALLRDVWAFAGRADVFNTILVELAREQDVFVVYLKDGQSVANWGYQSEIIRLRRHLPRMCRALDAYSKGRFS